MLIIAAFYMPNAFSQIKHISLNERLFELGKLPVLKVNIVADAQDIQNLEFILVQKNGEERLVVQQQNQFMLLAMGLEEVYDKDARLVVRYSNPIGEISLFNKGDINEVQPVLKHPLQNIKSQQDMEKTKPCTLEYNGSKTLWSLAKEYSEIWETNVYTTMLAIYYANSSAFYQEKISGLRKNAKLNCPTKELLDQHSDRVEAQKRYNSLNKE